MSDLSRAVWRLIIRSAAVIVCLFLLWFAGPWAWRLLSPFILAVPIAAALQKPIRWGEKRLHLKHGISVAIWVLLVCAILCVLLYWILSTVIGQVLQLSGNYQTIITDFVNLLRNVSNQIFDALDYLPDGAEEWIRGTLNDLFAQLTTFATTAVGAVFNFVVGFASGIPYGLIYLNFLLLGIFFISSDFGKIKSRLASHMGDAMRSRSQMLSGSAGHGLTGYVKVQFLYAVVVFVVSWPVLSLYGLPYAALIALGASILELLPIFGNGTLYIPWAIVCYLIDLPTLGTEMLALHLVLYIFRRVTEPKLMSNQMGLSTLLSLIAMFAGMQVGGVLGLILAPVVMVVVQSAWHGGIFRPTITDIRCVIAHVQERLAEPSCPEAESDAGDAAPQDTPHEEDVASAATKPKSWRDRIRKKG